MRKDRNVTAPRSVYVINDLISGGDYATAIQYAAENEEFYNNKSDEMRDLYVKARTAQVMQPINEDLDDAANALLDLSINK
jgi:hypothetical protein